MPPSIEDESLVEVSINPIQQRVVEKDIRIEDFLNDKLQTKADLANLADVIKAVDLQEQQLTQQLLDAQAKLRATRAESMEHAAKMLEQSQAFNDQTASIQNRLSIITSSDGPEEAMELLKFPMEKLRRVEMATLYVELVKEVDGLTIEAREYLPARPKDALKPYTRLKELAIVLRQLQASAEGAAPHLVKYVEDTSTSLWLQMKQIMSDEFEVVLEKSKWPEEAQVPTREWTDCFERLLDLQTPEIIAAREPLVLLPFVVLTRPFKQEFKFHFFSDKPTNHPRRLGDYVFDYFTGLITKWEPFLRENVAPILAAYFRGNALAGNALYVDPVSGFITALLPVVRQKVDSVLKGVGRNPIDLSKFIKQLLNFDETIRDTFDYNGGNPEFGWKGLTWDVLETWFDRWIGGEKDFAIQRYRDLIKSPDTGLIDYDNEMPGKTRPTYGATRVVDLIDSVTKTYNNIRRFSHKMRFLIEIQAEILDQYQGRLSESLDAYHTITNPVARTFHGISKEQQTELDGIRGIESLCKVYGSANYVMDALRDWSNSEFFIHLWGQLQSRAKRTSVHDNLAGDMSYAVVKDSTSTAVGSESEGSVFDVTVNGYARLRSRAEDFMIQALKSNLSNSMRHYLTRAQWTTVGEVPSILNVTAELDLPLQGLREYATFLQKTLSSKQYRHVMRSVMTHLQGIIWNELLVRQDFTSLGAARLSQDLRAIEQLAPGSHADFVKLRQGVTLLNLPLVTDSESGVTLMEASAAIYSTNAQAEEVLKQLGLDQLSRLEARDIMNRRVEAQE